MVSFESPKNPKLLVQQRYREHSRYFFSLIMSSDVVHWSQQPPHPQFKEGLGFQHPEEGAIDMVNHSNCPEEGIINTAA